MADKEYWEVLIEEPDGNIVRTPKIDNRREAILTAYGMLGHRNVMEIQGRTSVGWEVINLKTIRKEGAE